MNKSGGPPPRALHAKSGDHEVVSGRIKILENAPLVPILFDFIHLTGPIGERGNIIKRPRG